MDEKKKTMSKILDEVFSEAGTGHSVMIGEHVYASDPFSFESLCEPTMYALQIGAKQNVGKLAEVRWERQVGKEPRKDATAFQEIWLKNYLDTRSRAGRLPFIWIF